MRHRLRPTLPLTLITPLHILVVLTQSCQAPHAAESGPAPLVSGIKLDRDFWPVRCRFGHSDAKPLPLDFRLGANPIDPDSQVVAVLEAAGYSVEPLLLSNRTVPRVEWPTAAPADARRFTYPGTAVFLAVGIDVHGSTHAFGGVYAMCNSDPPAPDSITTLAQRLDAQIVKDAFEQHGLAPYRPLN